jgi:histone arginine demethylase JMJD6
MKYYKIDVCKKLLEDCPDEIGRINYHKTSVEEFRQKYELINKPVIFEGITDDWNVEKYWTWEVFVNNFVTIPQEIYQRYKDDKFKIGEDDDGYAIRIKLKYFLEYLVKQKDDSPLYLFESSLEDRDEGSKIIKRYEPPKFFREDFFKLVPENQNF